MCCRYVDVNNSVESEILGDYLCVCVCVGFYFRWRDGTSIHCINEK